jgi:hypothetical protein
MAPPLHGLDRHGNVTMPGDAEENPTVLIVDDDPQLRCSRLFPTFSNPISRMVETPLASYCDRSAWIPSKRIHRREHTHRE